MEKDPLIKNLSEKFKKADEEDDDDNTEDKPLVLPKINRPKNSDKTKPALGETNQPNKFLEWLRGGNLKEITFSQEPKKDEPGEFKLELDEITPIGEQTLTDGAIEETMLAEANNTHEIEPLGLPETTYAWHENDWIRLIEDTKPDRNIPNLSGLVVNNPANETSTPQPIRPEQSPDTEGPAEQTNLEYAETGGSGNDNGGGGHGGRSNGGEFMPADDNRRQPYEIHNIDPYLPVKLAYAESLDSKAQQEAVNEAAYEGERRGLRRGLFTGLLTGWYIERLHRKRVEKRLGKRLNKQEEAIKQFKKSEHRHEIEKYTVAGKFERLGQERRKLISEKFRPRLGKEKLTVEQKRSAATEKTTSDSLAERPLAIGHRLESSAWHSIEIDSKSGRAVANPEIPYGREFLNEQKQEKATLLYRFGITSKTATSYTWHIGKTALASTNKELPLMPNNLAVYDVKSASNKPRLTDGHVTDLINARPIIWGLVAIVVIGILLLFFR